MRVPVVNGHSEAVNVETRGELNPERARELLLAAPGVTVLDDPAAGLYPLAIEATGKDEVFGGESAPTPATSARSICGSSRTTCARARRPTLCSWPSWCTSADSRARRRRPRPLSGCAAGVAPRSRE